MDKKDKNLRVLKKVLIIFMCIILFIFLANKTFIFMVDRNERHIRVPHIQDINSIELISLENDIAYKKIIIVNRYDMERFLEVLENSIRVEDKHSISDFPQVNKFTMVHYQFKGGGNSWISFYREDHEIYIDQPYYRVFKLKKEKIMEWERIIESGKKIDISIPMEDLLKEKL